jgi:hypothetical protein
VGVLLAALIPIGTADVTTGELLADSDSYADVPRVVELRDRLRATITRLN